jgi:cell fate (sporulation/competence/biofilm development) regulator YmcA (YheA/YmcA/DUF963 family)
MPQWDYTIRLADVWKNPEMTFEQRRDVIVQRLRNSRWYKQSEMGLDEVVNDIEAATTVDEFDEAWAELYDAADWDRAWIATV